MVATSNKTSMPTAWSSAAGSLLRIGPFVAHVRSTVPLLSRYLDQMYAEYPTASADGIRDLSVEVRPSSFSLRLVDVLLNGKLMFRRFRRSQAPALFEWAANQPMFQQPHWFLIIHAAVVAKGDVAVILPAPSGSGKSTLCAALCLRGWRLLSDETAIFDLATDTLVPCPRPVSLKESSIDVVSRFAPHAELGPVCPDTPKGRIRHLKPSLQSIESAAHPAEAKFVVFPHWSPEPCPPTWSALPKGEAFLETARNAFNYDILGEEAFDLLGRVIAQADCRRFSYHDLDDATDAFSRLVS